MNKLLNKLQLALTHILGEANTLLWLNRACSYFVQRVVFLLKGYKAFLNRNSTWDLKMKKHFRMTINMTKQFLSWHFFNTLKLLSVTPKIFNGQPNLSWKIDGSMH